MKRVLILLTLLCVLAEGSWANERLPNFVVIFTDDQGYQDVGCFGSPLIKTPHLDQMATEGVKFTSFYSANAVCSPSRAALLTGCYPPRVGIPGVLFPRHTVGLNPDEVTIAELLKTKGYATACIGKWHLGHKPDFLPTRHGFDSYYGIPYSNDMTIDPDADIADDALLRKGVTVERIRSEKPRKNWVPLMRDEQVIEYPVDQSTLTRRYTEEAVKFVTANRQRPFFLYLPHTMPHIPLFVSDEFRGKSKRGLYGDTIEEIDASTGRILETLKALGLEENTLVIYTSDNGPWKLKNDHGGHADPLRGYKFSTYEGGMRVPCIMRWPGKIPSGVSCDEIAATIDLLPTFSALAGIEVPSDRSIDGLNIWSLLSMPDEAESPRKEFFYYRGNDLQAVRRGDWKLRTRQKGVELFNLRTDLSETTNVAEEHPAVVQELAALIESFDAELKTQARPAGKWDGEG